MNSKIIMILSAIFLGFLGIGLSFLPSEIISYLNINSNKILQIIFQLMGALFFSFAIMNWMSHKSIIGGIYNKPIAMANFTHFSIGGLALIKWTINDIDKSVGLITTTVIYLFFALAFGWITFNHPIKGK